MGKLFRHLIHEFFTLNYPPVFDDQLKMKTKQNLFIVFFLLFNLVNSKVWAEYPYEFSQSNYRDSGAVTEVTPSTPIKAQDGIGLCYGFSATSLLEHYRCSQNNSNCSESSDLISSLDVTSYYQNKALKEGGDSSRLLENFSRSKRKVAKEECIRFSALVHQVTDSNKFTYKDEKRGWVFLTKKWNEFRGIGPDVKKNDCISCLADEIKSTLVNIETPIDQLKDAFQTAGTLEEFLYKSLLPKSCLQESNMLTVPEYKTKTFPNYSHRGEVSPQELTAKITSILEANIPVEMSICTMKTFEGTCSPNSGHSIAVFGIKEVCNFNDCKKMVKVKNSYGTSWQNQNNNGWLDLDTLIESSQLMGKNNNITWLEKPGFVLPEKTFSKPISRPSQIKNTKPSITVPPEYSKHRGIWKCPGTKFTDHYEPGCVPMK